MSDLVEVNKRAHEMAAKGAEVSAIIAALVAEFTDEKPAHLEMVAREAVQMLRGEIEDAFDTTDSGNVEYFAESEARRFRYDHAARTWFVFGDEGRVGVNKHHWHRDADGEVHRAISNVVTYRINSALAAGPAKRIKELVKYRGAVGLRHTEELARNEQGLATDGEEWNPDSYSLGVENGVVDLLDGSLRPGRAEDMINRWLPVKYDPKARPHRWLEFLDEVFEGRPEMPPYLQRVLGYTLTADVSEQCFWIFYGRGANGKSTLLETWLRVIGDYAWTIPFPGDRWSESMGEYQKAGMHGRRLITSAEVSRRGVLHEEFMKAVTGGDKINARHPYGRPFEFSPAAKVFLRVNDKPAIRDRSHAMWRRVKLVEFQRTFPVNPGLADELARERAGILRWAVEGCLAWQAEKGLRHPAEVEAATDAYREETDAFGDFLAEACDVRDGAEATSRALFGAYQAWADRNKVGPADRLSQRAFGTEMRKRFEHVEEANPTARRPRGVSFLGVGLAPGRYAPVEPF